MSEVTIEALQPVMLVTCAWYAVSVVFLQLAGSGNNMVKDATPCHKQWGDRTFGNLMEQSPAFLVLMWSHAVVVCPHSATALGTAWLAIRCFYPVVYAATKVIPFVVTMPNYGILAWMFAITAAKLILGADLRDHVGGHDALGCLLGGACFLVVFSGVVLPLQRVLQRTVFRPVAEPSKKEK